MKFLRRLFGCPRYEWMELCPDTLAGTQALHEELAEGWEITLHWTESYSMAPGWSNHFLMHREI